MNSEDVCRIKKGIYCKGDTNGPKVGLKWGLEDGKGRPVSRLESSWTMLVIGSQCNVNR